MATDTRAQILALQATIAAQQAQLASGTTLMAENGRMMRFDLSVVQQQLNANVAALATLTLAPRQVRRLLTIQRGKGL